MKAISLLLTFTLTGVCYGADPGPATTRSTNGPTVQGKTLAGWLIQARDNAPTLRIEAARALGEMGPDAVPALMKLLKDKDDTVRATAAWALGEIGPEAKSAVPVLAESLKDNDVTWAAVEALGKIGPGAKAAVPALAELLEDKHLRLITAEALGNIGPRAQAAVPALAKALKDESRDVRLIAVAALGNIGPAAKAAVSDLTESLEDEDVRCEAVESLGKIGSEAKGAVPALTKLLQIENDGIQPYAIKALGRIGSAAEAAVPALTELLKAEEAEIAFGAMEALGNIGPAARTAVPALADLLRDTYDQEAIALTLSKIGPGAAPTLVQLLKDTDMHVRWSAVWALGEIGPDAEAVVPLLTKLLEEKNASVRQGGVWVLGQIGPRARVAVPTLIALLKDNDVLVRWAAVKALAKIASQSGLVVTALMPMLKDANGEVRDAAASALGRRNPETEATEAEIKRIERLIADLAKIDSRDARFSQTTASESFAPLRNSGSLYRGFDSGLVPNHGLEWNAAFTQLVELGPKALPFLLKSLDDKTPTRLIVKCAIDKGVMEFVQVEISANPFNTQEAKVLASMTDNPSLPNRGSLKEYTLKVGDICFIAVGQIGNHEYWPVHDAAESGFPSGNLVISSTVQDKNLAAAVRAIWGKSDYRQKLLDSLLVDFQTGWCYSAIAARHLAYYFPEATEDLILTRLKELEIVAAESSERNSDAESDAIVAAVSWSPRPKLHAKSLELFRKTSSPRTLLAALPAVGKEHDELLFRRIGEQFDALPDDIGPDKYRSDLLIALADRLPERAEGVFQACLKPGTTKCYWEVMNALQATSGHEGLATRLLIQLLDDKQAICPVNPFDPDEKGLQQGMRVCDMAATTIAGQSKTLTFMLDRSLDKRDRQIDVMRRQIKEVKPPK